MIKYFLLVSVLIQTKLSHAVELRLGDILLQPLSCWSCSLIEAEEETIYSHIGLVIQEKPLMVAEALGKVRVLPLEQYRRRNEVGQKLKVLRYKDFSIQKKLEEESEAFIALFNQEFLGLKYDHQFLWDNVDEAGKEKIYCSELLTKLFSRFGFPSVPVKKMHFDQNPKMWERYFRGKVPRGELGNSPGDFEKSELFEVVGEL